MKPSCITKCSKIGILV